MKRAQDCAKRILKTMKAISSPECFGPFEEWDNGHGFTLFKLVRKGGYNQPDINLIMVFDRKGDLVNLSWGIEGFYTPKV